MKNLLIALWLTSLVFSKIAIAGTNVLGFEINVSTFDQVLKSLSSKTKVSKVENNIFSNGPSFTTAGEIYDIEGLHEVGYIFDVHKKLTGVVMLMDKEKYNSVFDALSAKYKLVSQKKAFVGDQSGRFTSNDSVIEIEAPHLSFQMYVRYMRKDFEKSLKKQIANQAQEQKKKEASKF